MCDYFVDLANPSSMYFIKGKIMFGKYFHQEESRGFLEGSKNRSRLSIGSRGWKTPSGF